MRILHRDRTLPVAGVGFTPDGRLVAGGSGGFDLYDLVTLRRFSVPLPESRYVFAFVVDPLGRWLYLSMAQYGCRMHDLMTGAVRPFPGVDEGEDVVGLTASADGARVAVCRRSFRPGVGMQWVLSCWAVGEDAHS